MEFQMWSSESGPWEMELKLKLETPVRLLTRQRKRPGDVGLANTNACN